MSPILKYRGFAILAVVMLGLSLTVYFTNQGVRQLTVVEGRLRDILAPAEKSIMRTTQAGQSLVRRVTTLRHLERENGWLRDRVAFLESENGVLEEDRRENLRLRSLLLLRDSAAAGSVAARVIARDPANWASSLVIDKGTRDGIETNMPVLAPWGLVGRIQSASERTASVLLVIDSRSAVSALVRRSRDIVICEGSSERTGCVSVKPLNARLVGDKQEWSSQVGMRVGDLIVSSGLGGVFPKGIPIGRIVSIGAGRYGVSKNALVRLEVDLGRLEEVLVLPGTSSAMPTMAPGDSEVK